MNLYELALFITSIDKVYADWKAGREDFREEQEISRELSRAGLPSGVPFSIGAALITAKQYGIELHPGLTHHDCRAVMPRTIEWGMIGIHPDVYFPFGQFLVKPFKEVTEMQMLDVDICIAISKCVLEARRAGVI